MYLYLLKSLILTTCLVTPASFQEVATAADIWKQDLPEGATITLFNQKCSYKCSQKVYWDTVTIDLPFPLEETCPLSLEDDDPILESFEMDFCSMVCRHSQRYF